MPQEQLCVQIAKGVEADQVGKLDHTPGQHRKIRKADCPDRVVLLYGWFVVEGFEERAKHTHTHTHFICLEPDRGAKHLSVHM